MSETPSTPRRPWSAPPEPKGPATQVTELKDMVVAYARQETVDPLRTLGRHLGFGIGGALVIGTGWVFALLALLRGLQRIEFFNDPVRGWRWLVDLDPVLDRGGRRPGGRRASTAGWSRCG